nr:unnamed protein product [Callosobruchus chinensis]
MINFRFTESIPVVHDQTIDFSDDWNYKTDPQSVPLLKEGMGKFLTAFYQYSEVSQLAWMKLFFNILWLIHREVTAFVFI